MQPYLTSEHTDMPPTADQLFLARFDRLEANVERMSEALVKIARIDERNAGLQEVMTGQAKAIHKLSDDIHDGLKRAHERMDGVALIGERWSNFMENLQDRLKELEQTRFSIAESCNEINNLKRTVGELKETIEPLTALRNRLVGLAIGVSLASGGIVWFVQREVNRLDHINEQNIQTIQRLSLEVDRLQRKEPPQ